MRIPYSFGFVHKFLNIENLYKGLEADKKSTANYMDWLRTRTKKYFGRPVESEKSVEEMLKDALNVLVAFEAESQNQKEKLESFMQRIENIMQKRKTQADVDAIKNFLLLSQKRYNRGVDVLNEEVQSFNDKVNKVLGRSSTVGAGRKKRRKTRRKR